MKLNKLFVYGSLMAGIESPIASYLKTNSRFIGQGALKGQLYDLGFYPGLLYQANAKTTVIGHIFELNNPKVMLPKLDYYECVGPTFQQPNQYRREKVEVLMKETTISCWAYLYNLSIEGKTLITSGNYLAHFQKNKKYQRFVQSLGKDATSQV